MADPAVTKALMDFYESSESDKIKVIITTRLVSFPPALMNNTIDPVKTAEILH